MTDLATLAQAQAFVQDSTAASTVWVQAALDAASQAVIDYLGVDPSTQTRTEMISGANTPFLFPRASGKGAPITAVTSITINPALNIPGGCRGWWGLGIGNPTLCTVDITTASFDGGFIYSLLGHKFPRGKRNITIVFTSGYALTPENGVPNLPSSITQATLFATKAVFTALGKELNAANESYAGVLAQSFFSSGPGALPPAAKTYLAPYQTKMFSP